MSRHRIFMHAAIAFYLGCRLAGLALAQDYPAHAVKLVVPWPAGQATDLVARLMAEKMAPALGQPFVVDNRPGASGTIGTEFAAKAPADGYTLLAGSSGPISISPQVQKVAYDPQRDFDPVCLLASNPYVLVTHPSVPAAGVQELLALLRASPGKYSFASSGTGSTGHLITELFNAQARVEAIHVPYKGSPPAITDLIGGHVTYTFETSAAVLPHVKAGRLKALAVSSAKRSLTLPELPTVAEAAGLPGFDLRAWIGLLSPAGVPNEVRSRIATECQKQLDGPGMQDRFLSLGLEPAGPMAEDFADFLKKQNERFAAIARKAGLRAD